jgi:hypothetical protein
VQDGVDHGVVGGEHVGAHVLTGALDEDDGVVHRDEVVAA